MGKQTAGVLAVAAVVLLLGAWFAFGLGGSRTGAMGGPRSAAAFTSTISNAKQLGLAMLMYATDYDDVLPPMYELRTVESVLYPYMRNSQIWGTANPNGGRFLPNEKASYVDLAGIVSQADAPALYESQEWPDGRRIITYADAHTKGVTGFDLGKDLEIDLIASEKEKTEERRASDPSFPAALRAP